MTTPRGATPRDLEQRLRSIEQQLRQVTGAVLRREQLAVTEGDFLVSGGGNMVLRDGGDLRIEDGGKLSWFDPDDTLRMQMMRGQYGLVGFVSYGTSGARVNIGDIEDYGVNVVRQGILVENGDGSDVVWIMASPDSGRLFLTPTFDDQLELTDSGGNKRVSLGGVTYSGAPDGYGLWVAQNNGDTTFYAGNSAVEWHSNGKLHHFLDQRGYWYSPSGANAVSLQEGGGNAYIYGGTTRSGDALNTRIVLMGGQTSGGSDREPEFRVQRGETGWAAATASDWRTPSSREVKRDITDAAPGALPMVRSTLVKRWRYRDEDDDTVARTGARSELRMGPIAEDTPADLRCTTDDGHLLLSSQRVLWTAWQALQELADEKDQLQRQVDDLADRLERLEAAQIGVPATGRN